MGKIGFRIRSKVNKQVSIYVYLYGPFNSRMEAKTGFMVLREEWDRKKMRARIADENGVRLNNYLDTLERHLIFQYNNILSGSQELTRVWLESQISSALIDQTKTIGLASPIRFADTSTMRIPKEYGLLVA